MKKFLIVLIITLMTFTSVFAADTVKVNGNTAQYLNKTDEVKIIVNGEQYKGKHCFYNNRTMIDVWDFSQNYLYGVEKGDTRNWLAVNSNLNQEIIISRETDSKKVTFFKGSNKMVQTDGTAKNIDTTSFVYNKTNYVPLRYLCEEYGYTVSWDGKNKIIRVEKEAN